MTSNASEQSTSIYRSDNDFVINYLTNLIKHQKKTNTMGVTDVYGHNICELSYFFGHYEYYPTFMKHRFFDTVHNYTSLLTSKHGYLVSLLEDEVKEMPANDYQPKNMVEQILLHRIKMSISDGSIDNKDDYNMTWYELCHKYNFTFGLRLLVENGANTVVSKVHRKKYFQRYQSMYSIIHITTRNEYDTDNSLSNMSSEVTKMCEKLADL